jgi:hypothetical protein
MWAPKQKTQITNYSYSYPLPSNTKSWAPFTTSKKAVLAMGWLNIGKSFSKALLCSSVLKLF